MSSQNVSNREQVFSVSRKRWVYLSKLRRKEKILLGVIYIAGDAVLTERYVLNGKTLNDKGDRNSHLPPQMKIGFTTLDSPDAILLRLNSLGIGGIGKLPLLYSKAVYGTRDDWESRMVIMREWEKKMHMEFAFVHVEGEWFWRDQLKHAIVYLNQLFPGRVWKERGISKGFVRPPVEKENALPTEDEYVGVLTNSGGFDFELVGGYPGDQLIFSAFKSDRIDNPIIAKISSCGRKVFYPDGEIMTLSEASKRAHVDLGLETKMHQISGSRCWKLVKYGRSLRILHEEVRDGTDRMPAWRKRRFG